jgi:predicted unusual protein kinase regulating ubiquinone biosynthesis (AarF/ABC1/UbiB family)
MLGQTANLIAMVAPNVNLKSIVEFLKETLPLELDLRREARAMEELRLVLSHRPDVVIPKSFPEFSTERLLVMDYEEGIKITDVPALEAAGINPGEVVHLLNEVYAEQVFYHHFLHADPHPGNLMVQPGPKLVLLDHGLTVPLKPSLAQAMGEMVKALLAGQLDKVATALRSAGLKVAEGVDLPTLLRLVGVILGGAGTHNIMEVGSKIGSSIGEIPADLLLIGRALGMLNGIALQLDPKQDTLSTVARYVKVPDPVLVGV